MSFENTFSNQQLVRIIRKDYFAMTGGGRNIKLKGKIKLLFDDYNNQIEITKK